MEKLIKMFFYRNPKYKMYSSIQFELPVYTVQDACVAQQKAHSVMLWHIQWGKYFASPRQEEHSSMTSVDADRKCQTRQMQWATWEGSDLYMVYSFWFHFVRHHLPNILNSSFLRMNSLGVDILTKIEKFFNLL